MNNPRSDLTDPTNPRSTATTEVARHRLVRVWWLVIGFASVGTGVVGIIVPGLPTTVFFIVAAWCFSRSSPRFEQWVLELPRIGPLVADHRAGLGMPRQAKRIAITSIWVAITLSVIMVRDRFIVASIVIVAGAVGTAYIAWRVPTRETVLAHRAGNS